MKKVLSLLTIYCCLSVIYCSAQGISSIDSVQGVKEFTLSPFETVVAKGGGNLYFHYSPNTKVEIKGAGSCVEKINVEVSSNTLRINPKNGLSDNCRTEIHVFTPMVKEIQQDGGGSLVIINGFAPVEEFKCSIKGGGKVEMTALKVDSLLASIDGGGEISAQVNKVLHAKIRGGGVIFYQGDPTVASNVSGGGEIKRK